MGFDMHKNDVIMLKARNRFSGIKQELAKVQCTKIPLVQAIAFTEEHFNQMLAVCLMPRDERTTFDTLNLIDLTISMWFAPRCRTKADMCMGAIKAVPDPEAKCQFKFLKMPWFDKTNREDQKKIESTTTAKPYTANALAGPATAE